jgi:hypothetical protein
MKGSRRVGLIHLDSIFRTALTQGLEKHSLWVLQQAAFEQDQRKILKQGEQTTHTVTIT